MAYLSDNCTESGVPLRTSSDRFGEGDWIYDFAWNCLGYATIMLPAFIFIRYYQRRHEVFDVSSASSLYRKLVRLFVFGWKSDEITTKTPSNTNQRGGVVERMGSTKLGTSCLFSFCFIGLLCSHLAWGFYQEKMMTRDYYSYPPDGDGRPIAERFGDSQFIVFLNRILALIISLSYILIHFYRNRSSGWFNHAAPVYKYSYASISNILSSWCQYEALKYISFPTQVLGKTSKIIPTMLVGRIIQKKQYPIHQYAISACISAGVSLFLLSRADSGTGRGKVPVSDTTTMSGIFLIGGYLLFDSFTSNWQSALFQEYHVGEMQMMCGVNFFSTLLILVSLLERGSLLNSIRFMLRHTDFTFDCLTTSCCSAIGQLFIFFTISQFGPVVFAIIMTVRQAFSILLSCLYYGHQINPLGIVGLSIVFAAILIGQYLNRVCGGGQRRRV